MIDRRALPGVVAGIAGLAAAFAGILTKSGWLVFVAGACALVSGLYTLGLADRLRRTSAKTIDLADRADQLAFETDQMAARAARFEAEAITARTQLADAMRHEADRQTKGATIQDAVTDGTSGLFNQVFFVATLVKRVSAARRGLRPLALGLIEVVADLNTGAPSEAEPRPIAAALIETLREADTAARLDDGRFAVLLEDTPENGAVWTIERVRRRLADEMPGHTLWAGLSCYPAHAFDADQLLEQAGSALVSAKEWRQDRIEVAVTPDD
ncbi:MAG TPA: diguanylate cyclase [Acidimicrobiales bacterium]